MKKEKKKNGKGKIIERTQTLITAKKNIIEMNEQRIIDLLSHWKHEQRKRLNRTRIGKLENKNARLKQ